MRNACLGVFCLAGFLAHACQSYQLLDTNPGAESSRLDPDSDTDVLINGAEPVSAMVTCPWKLPAWFGLCGTPEGGTTVDSTPSCPPGAYPGWEQGPGECDHIIWTGECLACEPSCPEMIHQALCGTPPPDCPLGMYPVPSAVTWMEDCDGAVWGGECLPCP